VNFYEHTVNIVRNDIVEVNEPTCEVWRQGRAAQGRAERHRVGCGLGRRVLGVAL